jgi:hypothetical protein
MPARPNLLFVLYSMWLMPDDVRLSLTELRTLDAQVAAQPADDRGAVRSLADGMLAVIRAAIAAEIELRGADALTRP